MLMGRLAGVALELALAALLLLFLPPYYVYRLTASFLGSVFPDSVSGKVVLITGASSGIGEVYIRYVHTSLQDASPFLYGRFYLVSCLRV